MTCEAWPITWAHDLEGIDPRLVSAAQSAAQTILWSKTGRRMGVCSVTETYRMPGGGECGLPTPTFDPVSMTWLNSRPGGGECCWITLVEQPVVAIESVRLNGATLDASAYRLAGNRLGRIGACWAWVGECDDDPISVTYSHGIPIPDGGLESVAMGEVAWEVLQFLTTGTCRLPWLAANVTRNGVSVTLADPGDLEKINRLGLPIADALIAAANPYGRHGRSRVLSPDTAIRTGQWSA